ncbi:ABC transporter permease [Rhodovulum adriaticum]|uniref:ABC-2 type transport system permease protein n=1 Tax=Rhodovulum adriaticum TaxID=35804 RepID=A0A4R2NWU1_RHOAD|nr:ABC transporter permease [Rhodovulum adriaticum]MBK1637304.1 ABC transporter permease [Rhodovulum adriaticum]TCP26487.1 ABC-2 type transport system permease protein [Rhodovulum adriaticum]
MRSLHNIFRLGLKELWSLFRDPVLMGLVIYTFTGAVFAVANGVRTEVRNAAIAVIDEDRSEVSDRLRDAFLPPYFRPAPLIDLNQMGPAMDRGDYSFVLHIPAGFEADLLAGRQPDLLLNVDATAMTLAGNGTAYIRSIVQQELAGFLHSGDTDLPATLIPRAWFNPNLHSSWFFAVMQVIGNVTILSVVLSGAAVIREREHGTIEHLMVMPVTALELMLAKIWANGLVIVSAAVLSLLVVVQGVMGIPVPGSIGVFALGAGVYLFSVTALGIMLATFARTMPQFGLLAIPVFVVLYLLSGGVTPLEAMPEPLHSLMHLSPATHFTSFAQAVLYRGAGLGLVWRELLIVTCIGTVFLALAQSRFRKTMAAAR